MVKYQPELNIDMAPVVSKNLPYVWVCGQQNTGKKTHGSLIRDQFGFEHIRIADLLRLEATKDTERGHAVKECLRNNKKVQDSIVVELLARAMLHSRTDKGFVITNFPRTPRQADLFVKALFRVDLALYFYTDTNSLVERAKQRAGGENFDEANVRREIAYANRDIKGCLGKYSEKVENINTSGQPEEVFEKVEQAFSKRLNLTIQRPICTESDYVRNPGETKAFDQPETGTRNYMISSY
ncbi:unnamed protein product [Acanthoscelides obtectus]|uniref:Adenylate kinase n=1 Tax=Acanthoscelides obtectus TaxID=200917 RepID=A0A9P0LE58_ACAOB|nr:unnamed protein product [Acanthoscelides obtectus]CAK1642084.1 UMP-CMP kinase 1 [Acanthoscelides obtectus]